MRGVIGYLIAAVMAVLVLLGICVNLYLKSQDSVRKLRRSRENSEDLRRKNNELAQLLQVVQLEAKRGEAPLSGLLAINLAPLERALVNKVGNSRTRRDDMRFVLGQLLYMSLVWARMNPQTALYGSANIRAFVHLVPFEEGDLLSYLPDLPETELLVVQGEEHRSQQEVDVREALRILQDVAPDLVPHEFYVPTKDWQGFIKIEHV